MCIKYSSHNIQCLTQCLFNESTLWQSYKSLSDLMSFHSFVPIQGPSHLCFPCIFIKMVKENLVYCRKASYYNCHSFIIIFSNTLAPKQPWFCILLATPSHSKPFLNLFLSKTNTEHFPTTNKYLSTLYTQNPDVREQGISSP